MSGEDTFLAYTRAGLRGQGRAYITKHHDAFSEGIVDLSLTLRRYNINTWIELKVQAGWPARPDTKIFWDHFTEAQALFLRQRLGWLWVRIGHNRATYALFTGDAAWRMWEAGGHPQEQFKAEAHRLWFAGVRWREFVDAIR